jgi:multiple sugar transport system ATP-binding protein
MAFKTTSIYVTHDQTEAMTLADRIVVLRNGYVEQIGTPAELYGQPRNLFVAGFIGSPTMNFLRTRLCAEDGGLFVLPDGGPRLPVPARFAADYGPHAGKQLILGIRPEHVTNAWPGEDNGALVPLRLAVELAEPLGADTLIFSRIGEKEIVCRTVPQAGAALGTTIAVHANMNRMHLFERESGMALPRRN